MNRDDTRSTLGERRGAMGLYVIGRDEERSRLDRWLGTDDARPLLVTGLPGIGKSALLDHTARVARARGMRVLTTRGSSAEIRMAYVGLYELLGDQLADLDHVPPRRRRALLGAFGLEEESSPEVLLVGLAVLDLLLAGPSSDDEVTIVVDDIQWLDDESARVLGFVLRHHRSPRLRILASVRTGSSSPILDEFGEHIELGPLGADESRRLLRDSAPGLDERVARWVVERSGGIPLAVLELPHSVTEGDLDDADGTSLSPTERLMSAFAGRIADLPDAVRVVLLVAALNDSPSLRENLTATGLVTGSWLAADDLAPAREAGVVDISGGEFTFCHPLWKTVVLRGADGSAQHEAHTALARTLADTQERRIWHVVAITPSPDAELADELEAVAARVRVRGALSLALRAQELAVRYSPSATDRARRGARVGELAFERGDRPALLRMIQDSVDHELGAAHRTYLISLRERFDLAPWTDDDLLADAARARRAGRAGDRRVALTLLDLVVGRSHISRTQRSVLDEVDSVVDDLGLDISDPAVMWVAAFANPPRRAPAILAELRRQVPATDDPLTLADLGRAAWGIGACREQFDALRLAAQGLEKYDSAGALVGVLSCLAAAAEYVGEWRVGARAARSAAEMAARSNQPVLGGLAHVIAARFAILTGDRDGSRAFHERASSALAPFDGGMLWLNRAIAALVDDQPQEALELFAAMFTDGHPAFNRVHQMVSVADLAESATRAGEQERARVLIDTIRSEWSSPEMPLLRAGLVFADALLAPPAGSDALVEAVDGLVDWPFLSSRAALVAGTGADGRRRPLARRRTLLERALKGFDDLRATPWSARAGAALARLGIEPDDADRPAARADDLEALLGPREWQVARLAGAGLSNREIGDRLQLSPRTVSTYLYKVFPKLGVTSRVQLAVLLAPRLVGGRDTDVE